MVDEPSATACNATNRRAGRLLICELPLGHLKAGEDHKAGDETWPEPTW